MVISIAEIQMISDTRHCVTCEIDHINTRQRKNTFLYVLIHIQSTFNRIDPQGIQPSHLVQHKVYEIHEPILVQKGRCIVIKFRNGKSVTTLPFVIKNNSKWDSHEQIHRVKKWNSEPKLELSYQHFGKIKWHKSKSLWVRLQQATFVKIIGFWMNQLACKR